MILNNGPYTVYIHINKINGKMYVGITRRDNLNNRWHNGNGYKYNPHFWAAIQKYGWENFDHEIFASRLTEEEASNTERLLIEKLNTTDEHYGYNVASGGENCRGLTGKHNPFYGKTPIAAVKASISVRTGVHLSDEHKQKISNSNKGKTFTKEHIEKYAAAQRGVPRAKRADCKNSRRFQCVETGEIFLCGRDVVEKLCVSPSALTNSIKRNQKCGGYHWIKLPNSNDQSKDVGSSEPKRRDVE